MRNMLSEKALLVKFSSGMPGNSRKDKPLTGKVKRDNSLGESAGKWTKQLFPDAALAPLASIKNEFYTWLLQRTRPWPDEGIRLLPATQTLEKEGSLYWEIVEKSKATKAQWDNAVAEFMSNWESYVDWGKQQHNGTFDANNYRKDKAERSFKFSLEFRPIPATDQYSQEIADLIGGDAADVDSMVQTAIQDAQLDLWSRLRAPLAHMVEFLGSLDGKERTRFCESLIGNIKEIVDLVPKLDLVGDTELRQFSREIEQAIDGLSIESLKDSKAVQTETAQKAKAILSRMEGYFSRSE